MKEVNNVDVKISLIRAISLLMIITCHILQGLDISLAFWLNLGVQIFFFMSGYLYGQKEINDTKTFYKKRIKKILLPNMILVLVILLIDKLYFNINYEKIYILANLIGLGGFYGTLKSLTNTWFISYILICYLITPLLERIFAKNKTSIKTLFTVLTILILLQEFKVTNINPAWIGNYILGYYFTRCCSTKKDKINFNLYIMLLSIIVVPISLILKYNLITNIPEILINYKNLICDYEHVLLGTLIFLLLYKILSFFNLKYIKILEFTDHYSYYIYLTHQIFILFHMSILKLTSHLSLNILLIFIASILSGILLYYITRIIEKFINIV